MIKRKVLISGIGSGGTNCLLNTLSNAESYEFIGINANKHRVACSQVDYAYVVPMAKDERKYIGTINKIISKHDIDLFIPNSDIEVEVASKYKDDIKCNLFLPSYNTIRISQDKMLMHDFCRDNEIPVAKAIAFKSLNEIENIDKYFNTYPLWCRIKSGAGSKHTSQVYSPKHARQFIEHIMITNNVDLSEFIVSELLPGNDYLIMTTWKNGTLVHCKMAHRQSYFGKQGQSAPYLIKSIFEQRLYDFAIETSMKFEKKPNGNLNFDIKLDQDGEIALTEINPGRFYYNMSLFNNTSDINSFSLFLDTAFDDLPQEKLPIIGKEEKYFIRDQDNQPFILTEEQINNVKYADEI